VPADGTSTANYQSGDFGRLPFFGQLSGKHLPASVCVSVVPRSNHNRRREIRVQHLSAVRGALHRLRGDRVTDRAFISRDRCKLPMLHCTEICRQCRCWVLVVSKCRVKIARTAVYHTPSFWPATNAQLTPRPRVEASPLVLAIWPLTHDPHEALRDVRI